MLDVAIIASVIPERHELFLRSLETWQRSIEFSGLNCSINIWSEGCPSIELFSKIHRNRPNIFVYGDSNRTGSQIAGYNFWYHQVDAKVYIFTHPDLLFPENTVLTAFAQAKHDTFVAFKAFWMSSIMTRNIMYHDWNHPERLEMDDVLYFTDELLKGDFYANKNVRDIKNWESSTTYAIDFSTAARLFPLPDFGDYGIDDPYQVAARQRLGIKTYTVMDPILFHQYHPQLKRVSDDEMIAAATLALTERFGG